MIAAAFFVFTLIPPGPRVSPGDFRMPPPQGRIGGWQRDKASGLYGQSASRHSVRNVRGNDPTGDSRGDSRGPTISDRIAQTILALTARFLSGASVRWIDCQPDTCQRVYFANHTSHLDAVVIWSALPAAIRVLTRPVAAADYWTAGRVRRYLSGRVFNALLIDRKEIKVHRSPIDMMIREMGDRYSLILFPQGGRSMGPEVGEFKSGLYYLCKKRPDLECVPVYLDNMNRILPRGEVLPVPLLSRICFGPPLWLEAGEPKSQFLGRARQAVQRLKEA